MKWLRKSTDSLINYVADRFYERLRDRAIQELVPQIAKELDEVDARLTDLFKWLP